MKKVSEMPGCDGCPMRRLFPDNTFVAAKMPRGHDLVRIVVAEAPGAEEAKVGEPLVGGSGKWFDSMLRHAGLSRDGLTLTNCIQCQPPGNIFPTDSDARKYISKEEAHEAVEKCLATYVRPMLAGRAWKRVDLLGDKPLRLVGGRSGIFRWRGSPISVSGPGYNLKGVPTLHPAYIMRDQTMFPVAVNDLCKGLEVEPEFYNTHPSLEDVQNFNATRFAFDIETNMRTGEITMVGLSDCPTRAICVPFRGAYIPELKRIFSNATDVIGQNCIAFDLPFLQRNDVRVNAKCSIWDIMLMQHLRFPDFPHDLEFIASQFVSKPAWKDDKSEGMEVYNCRDVDVTLQSFYELKKLLQQEDLLELYRNVQVPLAKIALLMHETGFKVDTGQIKRVREKLLVERDKLELDLPEWLRTQEVPIRKREKAPPGTIGKSKKPLKYVMVDATEKVVPWRSNKQKAKFLYEDLAQERVLHPETGELTTGKIALSKITNSLAREGRIGEARMVKAIHRLNQLDETITTFAKEDMAKIDRMYPHFNVHGTSSGRLSSSNPNLQNIPESARCVYVPSSAGWKIVDVDYSQIENRLTAYFAGDTERLARFKRDTSFSEHRFAASLFLGLPYEEVEKDNDKDAPYGKAKRIVHGTNYGMGAKKISMLYDMDLKETKRLQDIWKKAIWPTVQWQNKTGDEAKRTGVLRTPFGRKRWFWTGSLYTEALSFLPQSTAADVIFRAMIGMMWERIGLTREQAQKVVRVVEALPFPARLILQVHDSLVFECPSEMVDELVRVVTRVMTQPWPELGGMSIPIGVKVGDSWGEAE